MNKTNYLRSLTPRELEAAERRIETQVKDMIYFQRLQMQYGFITPIQRHELLFKYDVSPIPREDS